MGEKVTNMVLKVDLQCSCCYKKIKKILCKFPQIRDQVYDEKGNKVTITVVCCSPEKIRDKLCCKGAKVIKSIEIIEPPKPKQAEKPKVVEKPKEPEKPKVVVIEKPKNPEMPNVIIVEKPKEPAKPKVVTFENPKEPEKPKPKSDGPPPTKPVEKPKEAPKIPEPAPNPPQMHEPVPVHGFPPIYPMQPCCEPCYNGYGGGPCHSGYGVPPPPQSCYDDYYGYGYGNNHPIHITRCDYYFSEENPQSCSIM